MPVPDGLGGVAVIAIRSVISFGMGYVIGTVIVGSYSIVSLAPSENGNPNA